MAKELYLYSPIYDFVAEGLISDMEANKGEDIVIRSNSPGGSVFAGWGIIAKMQEHEGKIKIKADGNVSSMAMYMLLFADEVEALDVTTGTLHRAAMYVESPEDQKFLDDVNAALRKKLASKINVDKLKELKGVSMDDIFNPEKRIDVTLSAKEMKEIGLVNRITKLSPTEIAAFNERMKVAAISGNQEKIIMDINKLKAEHPALYAEVLAAGQAQGVETEKKRVNAWLKFKDIDAEAVAKGISEGTAMDMGVMADFTAKKLNATALAEVEADSTGAAPKTKEVALAAVTAEDQVKAKQLADFEAELNKHFNIK